MKFRSTEKNLQPIEKRQNNLNFLLDKHCVFDYSLGLRILAFGVRQVSQEGGVTLEGSLLDALKSQGC